MKVSIIVAVYNIEKYLEKCLQSLILTNTHVNEIICVNDGSTDSSAKIVMKYQKRDKRIILLNKENGGISSARNAGIEKATGDYLIFVDGDDYVNTENLNRMLTELGDKITKEKIDAVWCGYFRNDWNGEHSVEPIFERKKYNQKEIRTVLLPSIIGISLPKLYQWFDGEALQKNQEFPTVWRFIYSRDLIDTYQIYFNEHVKTGEDILFNWEYLAHSNNIQISDFKYYHYVWRQGSLTQNTSVHFYQSKKLLIEEREKLNQKLKKIEGDYRKEYQATLVLTKIQMAMALSKCTFKQIRKNYSMFVKYAKMRPIIEAYKRLELNRAPLKYKIPLYIAKRQCNGILFIGCYVLSKLKIQIYPDE